MALMRFDPFREFDRILEQNFPSGGRLPRSMAMTARRRGDQFLVELDVPGVSMDDVELTADLHDGVLQLTIPVSEASRSRGRTRQFPIRGLPSGLRRSS